MGAVNYKGDLTKGSQHYYSQGSSKTPSIDVPCYGSRSSPAVLFDGARLASGLVG